MAARYLNFANHSKTFQPTAKISKKDIQLKTQSISKSKWNLDLAQLFLCTEMLANPRFRPVFFNIRIKSITNLAMKLQENHPMEEVIPKWTKVWIFISPSTLEKKRQLKKLAANHAKFKNKLLFQTRLQTQKHGKSNFEAAKPIHSWLNRNHQWQERIAARGVH